MFNYDYSTPRYPIREAAQAAGFELNTLRSLYQRGHFSIIGGEEAKARGLGHMLNLRDIMHVAVAKQLMEAGVHPKDAFQAAIHFAHVGSGGSGWVGEPMTGPTRLPAGLFDDGFTVLIYFAASQGVKIIQTNGALDFGTLFISPNGDREPAIVICLNFVEHAVFCALGVTAKAD
ncbi:MAG: hypothetical protein AABZ04_02475 [Pseudomonadota bacterium]